MIHLALWIASAILLAVCGLCVLGGVVVCLVWMWEQVVRPSAPSVEGESAVMSNEEHRQRWKRFKDGETYNESGTGKIHDAEIVD
jgi:hypothetical protein